MILGNFRYEEFEETVVVLSFKRLVCCIMSDLEWWSSNRSIEYFFVCAITTNSVNVRYILLTAIDSPPWFEVNNHKD